MILDGEIRGRLAGSTPAERRAMLSQALAAGDDAVVSAVLSGPAMLSGFEDPTEREDLRLRWQTARHPDVVAQAERYGRAATDIERAGSLLVRFYASLTDPEILARAEASERAVAEAMTE